MAQQRPDAASNEPGKWLSDSQTVIQSLKRPAMVVGMRLSGKSRLKVLKRRVEFIRFPEEPHGLSRQGRPDRRQVRLEKILEWFERYL